MRILGGYGVELAFTVDISPVNLPRIDVRRAKLAFDQLSGLGTCVRELSINESEPVASIQYWCIGTDGGERSQIFEGDGRPGRRAGFLTFPQNS
jgi:hypothetical protein